MLPLPNCDLLCAVRRSQHIPCKHYFLKIVFADKISVRCFFYTVQVTWICTFHITWLTLSNWRFFFFDGVNLFHLWNDGPRQKSHPYNLHPWYFMLSEVAKLGSIGAVRAQWCLSSCGSSDAFTGASRLRQINVTCWDSELWSSRHANVTKLCRESLAFPGPLPAPAQDSERDQVSGWHRFDASHMKE